MKKVKENDICKLVRDRLEHVDLIFELRHHYNRMELVTDVGENGWTHPWRYFDALMYYLLLTCFDLLGQPTDWVAFSTWLESGKNKSERDTAVATLPLEADPIATAKHLNDCYQKLYGVKNSFYSFVLKSLTDGERTELYRNIEIIRGQVGGDPNTMYPALGEITDERAKLDWLFSLRNKFTHGAVAMGSPSAGIFHQTYDAMIIDGVPKKGYIAIHHEIKCDERLTYQVRDWPYVLQRIIKAALIRFEEELDPQLGIGAAARACEADPNLKTHGDELHQLVADSFRKGSSSEP